MLVQERKEGIVPMSCFPFNEVVVLELLLFDEHNKMSFHCFIQGSVGVEGS